MTFLIPQAIGAPQRLVKFSPYRNLFLGDVDCHIMDVFRGFHQTFGERGMGMYCFGDIPRLQSRLHCHRIFMNKIGRMGTYDVGAEYAIRILFSN